MSRENMDALRAVYEEYSRGNFRAGIELYDPDVLLVSRSDLPDADRYVGVDSITAYMREFLAPVTNLTWTAEEFTDVENSIVVATHQRGMGKQSGIPMEGRYFVVWTFRGRAVIRIEFFADRADALEAVGLRE
jgi:ketosteroid isomerase-like protein